LDRKYLKVFFDIWPINNKGKASSFGAVRENAYFHSTPSPIALSFIPHSPTALIFHSAHSPTAPNQQNLALPWLITGQIQKICRYVLSKQERN
jgi:hypothetical protein